MCRILWHKKPLKLRRRAEFRLCKVFAFVLFLINTPQIKPGDPYKFVASLYEDSPVYVNVGTDKKPEISTLPTLKEDEEHKNKVLTLCMTFTQSGRYVLSGTSKGALNVIDLESLRVVHKMQVTNSSIKSIQLGPLGKNVVLNSTDRMIRLLAVPHPEPTTPEEEWDFEVKLKLQDFVNRRMWSSIKLTSTEDYVAATTFGHSDIYLWDTDVGSLTKIYDGPKEEMVDIDFHPSKSNMASTGLDSGDIHLWEAEMGQRWSALAPDFQELEANVEYEEREDEFDLIDEAEQTKRQLDKEEEDVDILTKHDTEYTHSFVIPLDLDDYDDTVELLDD
ncbi:hypothetical protein TRICI_001923 [Trichomonascus ciferrii]|uniref:Anaphase-promoting complex subunit 4 WD40 domain-containing protein n=1 Tax=Trichomonascus ciferrii TaxID=44093 RepID=A0A642V869_9ASCO|nr:hypothetical protein TRICI_001923 [Trichomonascus ciferrii]